MPVLTVNNDLWHLGVSKSWRNQKGNITPTISRSPRRGGIKKATHPLPSWGRESEEESKQRLHNSCHLGVPKAGSNEIGYIRAVVS